MGVTVVVACPDMAEAMQYPSSRAAGTMEEDIYDSKVWLLKVTNGSMNASDDFIFSDCIDGIRIFKRHSLIVICLVVWNLPPQVLAYCVNE